MKRFTAALLIVGFVAMNACVPLGMVRYRPDCPYSRADRVGFHVVDLPFIPIDMNDDWTAQTAAFDAYDEFTIWYSEKIGALTETESVVFADAYATYEDNFFDNQGLAFATFWLPSGSIVADVWRTYLTDDGILHILIEELRPIDGMTEDMRGYAVALEFYRDTDVVGVEIHRP